MKLKLIAVGAAFSLALAGCMAPENNTDEGARGNTQQNRIEQTSFENNTGDGMVGERNHNLMRDAERNQDRDSIHERNNNNGRYDVAEEAADRIEDEIDVIDGAFVLTTENNAYVAANLDTDAGERKDNATKGGELTEEVKKEISDIVRSVDNNIENVYVSTNPDFFDLADNYTNDFNEGRPVEGFFSQIGNMLERLFPQNR